MLAGNALVAQHFVSNLFGDACYELVLVPAKIYIRARQTNRNTYTSHRPILENDLDNKW